MKIEAAQELRAKVATLIPRSDSKTVAVAYHDLADDTQMLIDADKPFHPASTFKVCILMEVYRQATAGRFDLDESVGVINLFRSVADAAPFSLRIEDDSEMSLYARIGGAATIRELATLMITRSSNLATNILIALVDAAAVTAFMHRLGATGLEVLRGPEDNVAYSRGLNNVATARGLMQILEKLASGRIVSVAASGEMVEMLRGQSYNDGISVPLPKDVVVAHKTGWNHQIYHDAAIVYPSRGAPYVLVVMTRGLDEDTDGPALVQKISAMVFAVRGRQHGTPP